MLLVAIIDTGVDFFDEEVKRMKFVMKTTRPFDDSSFYFEHNCNKMKLIFGIE